MVGLEVWSVFWFNPGVNLCSNERFSQNAGPLLFNFEEHRGWIGNIDKTHLNVIPIIFIKIGQS